MNEVLLIKVKNWDKYNRTYYESKSTPFSMLIFILLTEELNRDYIKDWLLCKGNQSKSFEQETDTFLLRKVGEKLLINLNEDFDPDRESAIYETTPNNFIRILDDWRKISTTRPLPHEIIVRQNDNGDITFIANHESIAQD